MPRASKVHYIAPSAVSITPNANGSPNDLAVYVARGSKIKVYSPNAGIDLVDASFQEWTMRGRNRRLGDSTKPYTIYARLSKQNKNDGYLVFAAKTQREGRWIDKYSCVTTEGLSVLYQDNGFDVVVADDSYWYIRLGDVSLPDSGKREVTLDTGIVGTDQYNEEWNQDADTVSRRLTVTQSLLGLIGRREAQTVTFAVMYGWDDVTADYSFSVARFSGDVAADSAWNTLHTNTGASWTMDYGDLNAASCSFTVTARNAADGTELTAEFVARRNGDSLRYYLTVNTEIIRVDMNGDLTGSESGLRLVRSDVDSDQSDNFLMLDNKFLATNTGQGRGNITAQAWRVSGADTIQKADATDNLIIRAAAYTGAVVEEEDEVSETGYMSFLADRTCDKYVLELVDGSDESIIYDTRTVAIVRDGSASIVADFDDEMGAGAAASDGTMLSGIPYTSVAHLYKGSSVLSLTDAKIVNVNGTEVAETASYQDQDITAGVAVSNNTDAVLTLSVLGKNAPDNNKFGVRLTGGSESAVAYFYFNKFKAGSDGHVTLYQLAPDVTSVKVDKQGLYSASTVTVGVLKIDVDETGQRETNLAYDAFTEAGLTVEYKIDGAGEWRDYTIDGIPVGTAAQKVELRLTGDNNILWDTETIPVVKDGLDSSYIMKFSDVEIKDNPSDERWHTDFRPGDRWAIMSSNGGSTWYGPYPIIGEEGKPGDYTEFSFGISEQDITASSTTCPDDLPPGARAGSNEWHDGIVAVTPEKPYLWMRSGLFKWNTESDPPSHSLYGGYTYARVKGVDAADRYELEVSDTTWQIAQDGTTVTPGEITVKAYRVKANGDRIPVESSAWIAANPKLTLSVVMQDGTLATKTYAASELTTDSFTGNALKVKDVLSRWGKSITGIKNVTVELTFYKDASTVIGTATQTFNVLRNGRDGAIAVIADFDDEMISIPVQSDGSGAAWPDGGWTTTARLYKGTEQLALDDTHISAELVPGINECGLVDHAGLTVEPSMTYSADRKSVSVTIKGFTDNDVTNRKFVMQLTDASHQYTATCIGYVNKIPAGEGGSGKDAVLHQLALSSNAVHTDADGHITSSQTITAQVFKYKGEDQPVKVTDGSVWMVVKDSEGVDKISSAVSGDVDISLGTTCTLDHFTVSIYPLKNGGADTGILLDRETIPVLRDGRDGAIAVIADFDDEMISIPVQSDGSNAIWPSGGWTTAARLYRGTEQLALDDTHISAIQAPDANECGLVDYAGLTVETNMTYAADKKSVSVTIKGFNTNDIINRKFVMQLTDASHQYTATCIGYVNKIPAGEGGSGKDAVLYQLALSQNVIHTDADARLTSSGSVTAYVHKYKGEDAPALVTDQSIWIRIESVGSAGYGNAVLPQTGVLPSVGYVVFSAPAECHNEKYIVSIYPVKKNTTPAEPDTVRLLDQETIPVLRDGKKGDPGDTGNSVTLYYSQYIDKTPYNNWHATFTSNDIYAREVEIGSDGTTVVSWGEPFRIVGEQGIPGPDGKPGDYTDSSFGISQYSATGGASSKPDDLPGPDDLATQYGWSDGVMEVTAERPYLWMRKRLMTWNTASKKYDAGTPSYTRVTGEKGDKGEDGKDAAAYEFTRFSDDARLVNGVWTGTFTGKSDAAIQAEAAEQGDKCNLLPNTDFAEWDSENGVPAGWAMNASGVTASRITDGGKYWVRFTTNSSIRGITQSEEKENDSPLYLCPFVAGRTYTISARYKGNAIPAIGVQYYPFDSNNPQHWQSFTSEYADGEEHLLTFTFTCDTTVSATHIKVFFVSGTSGTYTYNFAQPKIEVGDTATDYTVAPAWNPRLNGTVQGLWKGVMRWGYPYASTVFSDYEWTKVRDAEPRMTNWEDVTAIQRPTANPDDTTYERNNFLCGSYGERYYDMAYDGTDYWLCKKSYAYDFYVEVENNGETERRYVTPSNTELWTIYWERASQFNFLMAQTLIAQRAYIRQLAVDKLHTTSTGAATIDISQGLINVQGKTTAMKIGVDDSGEIILQYYKNDVLVVDLGLAGLRENTQNIANSWYDYIRAFVDSAPNLRTSQTLNAHTKSEDEITCYGFSEGYTSQAGTSAKIYNVSVDLEGKARSNRNEPSPYNGRLFLSTDVNTSNGGQPTGSRVNGWLRKTAVSNSYYEPLEQVGTDSSGTPIYGIDMDYYNDGELTRHCEVYFKVGADDVMMLCDLRGNSLNTQQYPYIYSYYDSLNPTGE